MTAPLDQPAIDRLRGVMHVPELDERYVIGELLGRGGMGAVYRARDLVLDRDVAIKVTPSIDAGSAERLSRESRILAQLEHPGIVAVHDAGVETPLREISGLDGHIMMAGGGFAAQHDASFSRCSRRKADVDAL